MTLGMADRVLRGRLAFIGGVMFGGPGGFYLATTWGWTREGMIMLTILGVAAVYGVIYLLYSVWVGDEEEEEEFEPVQCAACGYFITEGPRRNECPSCEVPLG